MTNYRRAARITCRRRIHAYFLSDRTISEEQRTEGAVMFPFFIEAEVKEIEDPRAEHKRQKAEIRSLQVPEYTSRQVIYARADSLHRKETDFPGTVKTSALQINDPQIPSSRAHNMQDLRFSVNNGGLDISKLQKMLPCLNVYTPNFRARAEAPGINSCTTWHER